MYRKTFVPPLPSTLYISYAKHRLWWTSWSQLLSQSWQNFLHKLVTLHYSWGSLHGVTASRIFHPNTTIHDGDAAVVWFLPNLVRLQLHPVWSMKLWKNWEQTCSCCQITPPRKRVTPSSTARWRTTGRQEDFFLTKLLWWWTSL